MAADEIPDQAPGWGRRSSSPEPRVWESGSTRGNGIVPATQAASSITPIGAAVAAHSLMPFLIEPAHLKRAARECMRRASAPGADGQTWAAYRAGLNERLERLARELHRGSWRPSPLRSSHVVTYTGKRIETVIPTVADRIVHRAMRRAIEPVLEIDAFPEWVSGFRRGRSRITAIRQAAGHLADGRTWVADVDVQRVTDGASVEEVIGWLATHVHDGTFLNRVRTALDALPAPLVPGQGLSPLLLNLRLSRADAQLAAFVPVRFADNYCLFARSHTEAEDAYAAVISALARIGLTPHPGKSRIRRDANAEDLFLING